MNEKHDASRDDIAVVWHADDTATYNPVDHGFAVREEAVLQLERGPFRVEATVAAFSNTSLLRVRVGAKAVGTTVLGPDHLGFALPVSWTDNYLINGEAADENSLYLTAGTDCIHVTGGARVTLGVLVPRTPLVETVAALRGVDPADLTAAEWHVAQAPAAAKELRRRIGTIIEASAHRATHLPPQQMAQEVFGLMVEAYLAARPETTSKGQGIRRPDMIVKMAEERFMAAGGMPVSLADLCAAAGVSKSTLYQAFHRICGLPPLEYFHKRRLTWARVQLQQSYPQRGGVKRAALGAGFTEFGRFAKDYRRLFGESPSTTLNRHPY